MKNKLNLAYNTMLKSMQLAILADKDFACKEIDSFSFLILRVNCEDKNSIKKLNLSDLSLPKKLEIKKITHLEHEALLAFISPDEYLLMTSQSSKDDWYNLLEKHLKDEHFALVDVSGTYSFFKLQGDKVYPTLGQLVYYDLKNMPTGKIISTLLLQSPAIFFKLDADSIYFLCRNSYAVYVYKILEKALAKL